MSQLVTKLNDMIRPAVEALGFTLWGIEFVRAGKHSTLRVFIDHQDGIDVDDCADVSHQVSALLDVEDPISTEYVLEVSSPGLDRPLFHAQQFIDVVGEIVVVKTTMPQQGRRNFKGQLIQADQQQITIKIDNHDYVLALSNIAKAHIEPNYDEL